LFHTFKERYERQHQLNPVPLKNADLSSLTTYQWPGNVRELKHCAERFLLANQRTPTSIQSILDAQPTPVSNQPRNLRQHVEQFEKALIRQALVDKEGHIANVCDHLNIPRRTLNEKLLKYDLNRLDFIRK
jgi:two-component system C4-dicarboxylate transport response regulator DctD